MNTLRARHKSPDAHLVGRVVTLTADVADPASGAVYPAGTRARVAPAYRGLTLRLATGAVLHEVAVECVREAEKR